MFAFETDASCRHRGAVILSLATLFQCEGFPRFCWRWCILVLVDVLFDVGDVFIRDSPYSASR